LLISSSGKSANSSTANRSSPQGLYLHRQLRLMHQTASVVRVSMQSCHTPRYFSWFQLLTFGLSAVRQTLVQCGGHLKRVFFWRSVSSSLSVMSTGKQILPFRNRVIPSSTGSDSPFLDCLTLNMKILWPFETPGNSEPMAQPHIPEDLNTWQYRCDKLKSRAFFFVLMPVN